MNVSDELPWGRIETQDATGGNRQVRRSWIHPSNQ